MDKYEGDDEKMRMREKEREKSLEMTAGSEMSYLLVVRKKAGVLDTAGLGCCGADASTPGFPYSHATTRLTSILFYLFFYFSCYF